MRVRKIAICARSKCWWNEDVESKKHQLGWAVRWKGRAGLARPQLGGSEKIHLQGEEAVLGVISQPR